MIRQLDQIKIEYEGISESSGKYEIKPFFVHLLGHITSLHSYNNRCSTMSPSVFSTALSHSLHTEWFYFETAITL